jgi:hypothetical protein
VEFVVYERNQSLEGTLVAVRPLEEKSGDLRGMVGNSHQSRPICIGLSRR